MSFFRMAFSLFLVFCIFFILEIYLNAFYINSLIIPFSLAFLFLFYFYKAFPLKVEKKISFLVILVVLILYVIGFYFGEDFLSDDYFYHLNITFPILFYKNVLLKEPFSLNNYSLGYPKFSEFLGAFFVYTFGNYKAFFIQNLILILASFYLSLLISKELYKKDELLAFVYSLNLVNIGQALSDEVDSLSSFYLLISSYFFIREFSYLNALLFFMSEIALSNIKYSSFAQALIILFFYFIKNRSHFKKLFLISLPFYFPIFINYLENLFFYKAIFFPFVDTSIAKDIANIGQPSFNRVFGIFYLIYKLSNIDQNFAANGPGEFGILGAVFFPFLFLSFYLFIKEKNKKAIWFYSLALISCLIMPTTTVSRYFSQLYFLIALSFFKTLDSLRKERLETFIGNFVIAFCFLQALYLIFSSQGILNQRLNFYRENKIFFEALNNKKLQNQLTFYYNNSVYPGFYWLMKYNGISPILSKPLENQKNYVYVGSDFKIFYNIDYKTPELTIKPLKESKKGCIGNKKYTFLVFLKNEELYKDCKILKDGKTLIYLPFDIKEFCFTSNSKVPNLKLSCEKY